MSKIQFNLLPDSKIAYNKAEGVRQKVRTVALIASGVSLSLFIVLLLIVDGVQKSQMTSTAKQIDSASAKLKAIPDIDKVLTVQSQIKSLSQLHQSKHVTSRIFTYLPQLTPANVTVNKLDLDLKQNTIIISGNSDSLHSVNTFVDTLKAATYKVGSSGSPAPAFASVVESSFGISSSNISYTISMQVDPKLFANNLLDANGKPQTPKLVVTKANTGTNKSPSSTLFNSTQTGR
jgi:Tfp pilus assembly protein PilN